MADPTVNVNAADISPEGRGLMNEDAWTALLTEREVWELHSLSRYPPMGLDDVADAALEGLELIECTVHPGPDQSSRWELTELGNEALQATADQCRVGHCPCRGGPHADDVGKAIADTLRGLGL